MVDNIVKNVKTPQSDLQILWNPYQNSSWLLCKNWKTDPKIHMEVQGAQDSQSYLEEAEQSGRTHFKCYYKSIVLKSLWYCHKFGYINLWDTVKIPGGKLTFTVSFQQGCQQHSIERIVYSTNGAGKAGYLQAKEWI